MRVDSNSNPRSPTTGCYSFGDFRFDLNQRKLWDQDEPRPLSPKAFSLLEVLICHVDQVVPSQTLLDEVWPAVRVEDSVLKVRIAEIRAALGETGASPEFIHTHPRVGYRFAGPVRFLAAGAKNEPKTIMGFSQRPALAILPFDDFSSSADDDYFADGIVEELTTRLARFRYFPVIARNSAFVYKGKPIDVPTVSRELGARYLLEGSVQRSEDQARIIVQLIDGDTGHHVWTDRFESGLTSIFELNDEITDRIAGAMHSQVYAVEVQRAVQRPPTNLDAWYCLLRAWALQDSMDSRENSQAKHHFLSAIELDPACAQAYSGLAMSHFRDVVHGWSTDPVESVIATRDNAARSLSCDPQDPYSHLATAVSHWLSGRRDDLLASIEHAVWLNPSLAWGYLWGGIAYGVAGDPDRSMEMARRAIQLSPLDPMRALFDYAVSIAHFSAGHYEQTYDAAKKAAGMLPSWGWPYCQMAAAAGLLGWSDEAQSARTVAQDRLPGLSPSALARLLPFVDSDFLARSIEGVRIAGWQD